MLIGTTWFWKWVHTRQALYCLPGPRTFFQRNTRHVHCFKSEETGQWSLLKSWPLSNHSPTSSLRSLCHVLCLIVPIQGYLGLPHHIQGKLRKKNRARDRLSLSHSHRSGLSECKKCLRNSSSASRVPNQWPQGRQSLPGSMHSNSVFWISQRKGISHEKITGYLAQSV